MTSLQAVRARLQGLWESVSVSARMFTGEDSLHNPFRALLERWHMSWRAFSDAWSAQNTSTTEIEPEVPHSPSYCWSTTYTSVRVEGDRVTVSLPFTAGFRPTCQAKVVNGRVLRLEIQRPDLGFSEAVEHGFRRTIPLPCKVRDDCAVDFADGQLAVTLSCASEEEIDLSPKKSPAHDCEICVANAVA